MNNFHVELNFITKEYIVSGLTEYEDKLIYWQGDSCDETELSKASMVETIGKGDYVDKLVNYPSEFFLVDLDTKLLNLKVYSDFLGKNIVFYYKDLEKVIISNNFYELASRIDVDESKINNNFIKQSTIHNISLNNETIVNGLNIIPPSTELTVDINNKQFNLKKYNDLKFIANESITLGEVASNTYDLFLDYFRRLKSSLGDKTFGIGLSGGLDSRIIAKLALDSGLKLQPFCIGQKHGKIFKTNGYKLSQKISKLLNIDNFKFIEYESESYKNKLSDDITYYPYKSSNIMISNLNNLPDFDFMLNGEHGGVFFGEFDFKIVADHNLTSLPEYLLSFLSFNDDRHMIISKDEFEDNVEFIKEKILSYGTDNRYDCFYKFFFEEYGSKSKYGFFESAYGTKPRFTPFLDRKFVDYFLTWPTYIRFSRIVQYRLLTKFFPQFNSYEDESSDSPVIYRKDEPKYWVIRFLYALKNKIFGPSLDQNKWIKKSKTLKSQYDEIMNKNSVYINECFPDFDSDIFYYSNPRAALNFMKNIALRDVLLNTDRQLQSVRDYLR